MSDETDTNEPVAGTDEQGSIYTVDWRREPAPLYANAAAIDFGPDAIGLVFLDAAAHERRLVEIKGQKRMVAIPVASIRMTHSNFIHFLQALTMKWNEFADSIEVPPGAIEPPKFEIRQGKKEP